MTRTKAEYVDDPDRDFDLRFECHVLLLDQKYNTRELRQFVYDELGRPDRGNRDNPNYFMRGEQAQIIRFLDPEQSIPDEVTGIRRVLESLTDMPRRKSLTKTEAKTFNGRELGYIIAALRGTREEMENERR